MLKYYVFHRINMFLIVFFEICFDISSPNQNNLLMKDIVKSIKNTFRLLRSVMYVAKKVFLLM